MFKPCFDRYHPRREAPKCNVILVFHKRLQKGWSFIINTMRTRWWWGVKLQRHLLLEQCKSRTHERIPRRWNKALMMMTQMIFATTHMQDIPFQNGPTIVQKFILACLNLPESNEFDRVRGQTSRSIFVSDLPRWVEFLSFWTVGFPMMSDPTTWPQPQCLNVEIMLAPKLNWLLSTGQASAMDPAWPTVQP